MLKAYDVNIQYLGETGYAFQRRYDLRFSEYPDLQLTHQERPTAKYNFVNKKSGSMLVIDGKGMHYNFLCGKTLKVSEDRQGCMIGAPVRVKLMV